MLATIAVLLLFLWVLGMIGGFASGWLIHLLLVSALILAVFRVIQRRRLGSPRVP